MWQRFTESARKVIFYSQEEAQKFGEGYVSTEHILLGVVREMDSMAIRVLHRLGVEPAAIRADVEKQLPRGDARPSQDMMLTPRAKRVIDLSYDEARSLNNNYIGTEHLLLGLVREGDGLAGRALAKFGVDIEKARRATIEIQEENPSHTSGDPTKSAPAAPVYRQAVIDLPVRYDFHLLHPIDQMLLSFLSERDTQLGKKLRARCSSLGWILPAIVAAMAKWPDNDASLETVLTTANYYVDGGVVGPDQLYKACYNHTTNEVRAILMGLELIPDTL